MRLVKFHAKAKEAIRELSKPAKNEIGGLLLKLQVGITLGMPDSKPMPSVSQGVHELRVKDSAGIYRVFYYIKSEHGILVFHVFTKKTQKTPLREIELARKRLREML